MHDAQAGSSGLIGPNAILQLLPVMVSRLGAARTHELLHLARLSAVPDGSTMIPEAEAARLHQTIRTFEGQQADAILREAGERTADYILAHRIPKMAQAILKILPSAWAARILSRAITQHAWTFAGSGQFRAVTPWHFEIDGNPLIAGQKAQHSLCIWHAAVFAGLYRALVSSDRECVEARCGAVHETGCCRFILRRKQVVA